MNDPTDPFGTLGVPADVDADTLRRAYLRLVRKHRPERDPEGFRRVREAYEFAVALRSSTDPAWSGHAAAMVPRASDASERRRASAEPVRDETVELARAIEKALASSEIDRAVALCTSPAFAAAVDDRPHLLAALLRTATATVWNAPAGYRQLLAAHESRIRANLVSFDRGIVVHLESTREAFERWSAKTSGVPALRQLLGLDWIANDGAFGARLTAAAREIERHPTRTYRSLVRAVVLDEDLPLLWLFRIEQRLERDQDLVPSPASVERVRNDPVLRRRLRPNRSAAVLGGVAAIALLWWLTVEAFERYGAWALLFCAVYLALVRPLAWFVAHANIGFHRAVLRVVRRCIELRVPVEAVATAMTEDEPAVSVAADAMAENVLARLMTMIVAHGHAASSSEIRTE